MTETEDGAKYVFLLVVIFSRMVFRPVEESIQKQKRFITDASHELKTPLTIIDANTEVMEMESGESQYHGREQKWQRINDYRYLIKKDQRRKNTRWTNCPPGIFFHFIKRKFGLQYIISADISRMSFLSNDLIAMDNPGPFIHNLILNVCILTNNSMSKYNTVLNYSTRFDLAATSDYWSSLQFLR